MFRECDDRENEHCGGQCFGFKARFWAGVENKKSLRPPEKMEDPEKSNISCFVRNVDKGNLFVLKVELIPCLRAFACLETLQTKMDFSCLIWWKTPQDLRFYNLARQYPSQMVFLLQMHDCHF